ncbi:MAG: MerR family DNA-binding transcriptional regulator, partial [Actinomycetota bacterium]
MTIGVFAERTGLSISAIRFYADQNLLVPAEVDGESG